MAKKVTRWIAMDNNDNNDNNGDGLIWLYEKEPRRRPYVFLPHGGDFQSYPKATFSRKYSKDFRFPKPGECFEIEIEL